MDAYIPLMTNVLQVPRAFSKAMKGRDSPCALAHAPQVTATYLVCILPPFPFCCMRFQALPLMVSIVCWWLPPELGPRSWGNSLYCQLPIGGRQYSQRFCRAPWVLLGCFPVITKHGLAAAQPQHASQPGFLLQTKQ